MVEQTIKSKAANLLVPKAEANMAVYSRAMATAGLDPIQNAISTLAAKQTFEGFRKFYGGLWVGGKVELLTSCLRFEPNAINNLVHKENYSLSIPLCEIDTLTPEFGVLSGIIVIKTRHGEVKIRCFRSKEFMRLIEHHCDNQYAQE